MLFICTEHSKEMGEGTARKGTTKAPHKVGSIKREKEKKLEIWHSVKFFRGKKTTH
jgi:hypothetical protein